MRRLLTSAALVLTAGAAIISSSGCGSSGSSGSSGTPANVSAKTALPVDAMQSALGAKGKVTNGVLDVSVDRTDITNVKVGDVPIKPSFELNGDLTFQPLTGGKAFYNGDIPVKAGEINGVIDAITKNGLTFQAEHQHLYDFSPMVWFIHFRGVGDPVGLAKSVRKVLDAASVPLPQQPEPKPVSSLDEARLQKILRGDSAEVGGDGVVTVSVPRRDQITIGGVKAKPEANISTVIEFEPLDKGKQAAAVPDFAMEAGEIDKVTSLMRGMGWDIGCLYNQETAEQPQLYFSHQLKTGDPYKLAGEIRKGLDRMNST
jgi:hypothetical protein